MPPRHTRTHLTATTFRLLALRFGSSGDLNEAGLDGQCSLPPQEDYGMLADASGMCDKSSKFLKAVHTLPTHDRMVGRQVD